MENLNDIKELLEYVNHPLTTILKDSSTSPYYIANPETLKPSIKNELEFYETIREKNCFFDKTIKRELYNYDINKPDTFPESLLREAKKIYLENSKYVNQLKVMQYVVVINSAITLITSTSFEDEEIKKEAESIAKTINHEQSYSEFLKIEYLYAFEILKFKTVFMLLKSFLSPKDY